MARDIILLDITKRSNGDMDLSFAIWLTAPTNRIRPLPTFVSVVPLLTAVSWGITAGELAALQAGTVLEQMGYLQGVPTGTGAAAVQAQMIAVATQAQNDVNAVAAAAKFIGSFHSSPGGWTAAP